MTPKAGRIARLVPVIIACVYAGVVADWWLQGRVPTPVLGAFRHVSADRETDSGSGSGSTPSSSAAPAARGPERPIATTGEPIVAPAPEVPSGAVIGPALGNKVDALQRRDLRVPIDGADVDAFKGEFDQRRGGDRPHEAVDILAPRNTPVRAVEAGTIAKLFYSKAGGITIYQYDPGQQFCYYYAHLERYADGLREGQHVASGDVIGFVGTTGNAPPGTPHLHFAIFELTPDHHWWQGRAIDPYDVFHRAASH